jgi:uncharacterized LabA/DUF88 family protein
VKTALLIDGGYLRASSFGVANPYNAAFIDQFARKCMEPGEYLLRAIYYDAPQFEGSAQLPVSGNWKRFRALDNMLDEVAQLERFAVRRGNLGFRGWKPRNIPIAGGAPLTDADFKPIFEQKGVDMRVGLDIAAFANLQSVERIVLVSGDTDMIPAMKEARRAGLEVVLAQLPAPTRPLHKNLIAHTDITRAVAWPTAPAQPQTHP